MTVSSSAPAVSTERSHLQRIANVAMLIGGYGLGQGAIFAVQTWLVARAEYDLLSAFGTHFSFAMFGIILVEMGSNTTLAHRVARLSGGQGTQEEFWQVFWDTTAVRLGMAILVSTVATVYALAITSDSFSCFYLLSALPGFLFWTCSAIGLLDGLRLSGISGITGSIAYATSAAGLVFALHKSPSVAGAILGGTFSLGYFLSVSAQWAALRRLGRKPQFQKPDMDGMIRAARDGLALLFQFVPGQLIARFQLALSAIYLGSEITAMFVYAKQIVVGMTMLIGFILRVDFPGLVNKMAHTKQPTLRFVFQAQKTVLYCAIIFTIGTLLVCALGPLAPHTSFARASVVLIAFAPSVLTISALMIISQGLAAMGDYFASARVAAIGAAIGMLVSYVAIGPLTVYALIVGEIISHLVGFGLLYLHFRQLRVRIPAEV